MNNKESELKELLAQSEKMNKRLAELINKNSETDEPSTTSLLIGGIAEKTLGNIGSFFTGSINKVVEGYDDIKEAGHDRKVRQATKLILKHQKSNEKLNEEIQELAKKGLIDLPDTTALSTIAPDTTDTSDT